MGLDDYTSIGKIFAIPVAIVAFIGGWWYATATYGFLFGFGLGWLPAGILAGLCSLVVTFTWPLIVLGIGAFVLSLLK